MFVFSVFCRNSCVIQVFFVLLHTVRNMIRKIGQYYTRAVTLLMLLLTRIYVWAQDAVDDEDELTELVPIALDEEEEDSWRGLFHVHFSYTDWMIIAVVCALFYVMMNSKLKKGCWYSVLYCILVILLIVKCT